MGLAGLPQQKPKINPYAPTPAWNGLHPNMNVRKLSLNNIQIKKNAETFLWLKM